MGIFQRKLKRFGTARASVFLVLVFWGSIAPALAHGGEDHGDEKPKTVSGDKGTVLHTTRLGGLEVSLKHPLLVPDTATFGRLFVTRFETNEPFGQGDPAIEIEGATGSAVAQAIVERSETAGVYVVKFPALPQGTYTIRAKLTYSGETDTAAFSGVEVAPASTASAEDGEMSWTRTVLIAFIFSVVLSLLGGLVYFVLRFSGDEPMKGETASV
jgi:hypothetical protein